MELKEYRFDEVTNNFDKKRIPLSSAQREKRQGKYRYYGAQGVIDHIDDFIFDGTYLLIAEDGENLKSKKQNIAQVVDGQFWVNNHAHIVQGNELCDTRYLCYLLNSMDLSGYVTGSAQPKLSQANLNAVTLLLPTITVQKKIVHYLYMFDKKITVNQQINDNLQQQAQAIFHEWFLTRVKKAPENYCIVSLADLMDYSGGSQPPASMFISEPKDGYIRFVQIRDYESDSHLTYIPISPRNKLCDESDIMIARYGAALGRICFGLNGAYNVALAKVFPKQPYFREFLRCYLSSREFYEGINNKGGRSAQAGFNQSDIRSFELYIPREESMFHAFDDIAKPMFEKRLNIIKENSELAKLRDTLLPKLMSGEIDVSSIQL